MPVVPPLAALRYVMYFWFMDNVTFGCNGPHDDAWSGVVIPGQSLMSINAPFCMCNVYI